VVFILNPKTLTFVVRETAEGITALATDLQTVREDLAGELQTVREDVATLRDDLTRDTQILRTGIAEILNIIAQSRI